MKPETVMFHTVSTGGAVPQKDKKQIQILPGKEERWSVRVINLGKPGSRRTSNPRVEGHKTSNGGAEKI